MAGREVQGLWGADLGCMADGYQCSLQFWLRGGGCPEFLTDCVIAFAEHGLPEFLTDCVIAFAEHGLPEQRVKLLSGGLQSELPLPSLMWYGYRKVLPPWIV